MAAVIVSLFIGFLNDFGTMRENQNSLLHRSHHFLVVLVVVVVVVVVMVLGSGHISHLMTPVVSSFRHLVVLLVHVLLLGMHVRIDLGIESFLLGVEGILTLVMSGRVGGVLRKHTLSISMIGDQSILLGVVGSMGGNQLALSSVVTSMGGNQFVLLGVMVSGGVDMSSEVGSMGGEVFSVLAEVHSDGVDHSLVGHHVPVDDSQLVLSGGMGGSEVGLTGQQGVGLFSVGSDSGTVVSNFGHDVLSLEGGVFEGFHLLPVSHGVVALVVEDLSEGVVLSVEGLGLSEVDLGVPIHLLVQNVELITVLGEFVVEVHGRGVHKNNLLLLNDVLVRDAVLFIVHVLALDGALLLIQGAVTVEPDVQTGVGAVGPAGIHVEVSVGCTHGLGLRVGRAFAFAIQPSALAMTGVHVAGLAVEESSGISSEEVDGTLVIFDEPVGVTGSGEGGLILEAVSIQDLRVLGIRRNGPRLPCRGSRR